MSIISLLTLEPVIVDTAVRAFSTAGVITLSFCKSLTIFSNIDCSCLSSPNGVVALVANSPGV